MNKTNWKKTITLKKENSQLKGKKALVIQDMKKHGINIIAVLMDQN